MSDRPRSRHYSTDPDFRRAVRDRMEAIQAEAVRIMQLPPKSPGTPSFVAQLTPEQLAEIAALMARYGYEEKELMLKHCLVVAMQLAIELEEVRLLARMPATDQVALMTCGQQK